MSNKESDMFASRKRRHWQTGILVALLGLASLGLTVEKISLERMTLESSLIVHGTVLSSRSQWEGNNIYTHVRIRVHETIKGARETMVTVKQLGGKVGDIAAEIPGTPELLRGEEVVLFLTRWQGTYWIHSVVLGKFTITEVAGESVVVNDLRNIGLIDPVTKREVTDPGERHGRFPLEAFLADVRSFIAKQGGE